MSANASQKDGFGTALQVAGALGGALVTKSKTRISFQAPGDVRDALPPDAKPSVNILWSFESDASFDDVLQRLNQVEQA